MLSGVGGSLGDRVGRGAACGKLIVFGEHAVVYGRPAIAVGLPHGARATARAAPESTLSLGEVRQGAREDDVAPSTVLAFDGLLDALGVGGVQVRADLDMPAGVGLGASAALGVAIARAVADLYDFRPTTSPVASRVSSGVEAWEGVFHGHASGVDAATAQRGGCLCFQKGREPRRIALARSIDLAVARIEDAPSTRSMVTAVRERRDREPARFDAWFDAIAELADEGETALAEVDEGRLGALMNRNHQLLRALGVSTRALDRACQVALDGGAHGAKLTGAGGGGCVLAVAPSPRATEVVRAWRAHGWTAFVTTIAGGDG